MNNFLKATMLGLTFTTLFSAQASATIMTCTHINDPGYVATITSNEAGEIQEIKSNTPEGNEVFFSVKNPDQQIVTLPVSSKELRTNEVLTAMKNEVKFGNNKYKSVEILGVISLEDEETVDNVKDFTAYIYDDGSGTALLRFKDANNQIIGATLHLDNTGFFNNCK